MVKQTQKSFANSQPGAEPLRTSADVLRAVGAPHHETNYQ